MCDHETLHTHVVQLSWQRNIIITNSNQPQAMTTYITLYTTMSIKHCVCVIMKLHTRCPTLPLSEKMTFFKEPWSLNHLDFMYACIKKEGRLENKKFFEFKKEGYRDGIKGKETR